MDKLLQWILAFLAMRIAFTQSDPLASNELGTRTPAPAREDQRTVGGQTQLASSGPLPVFRSPIDLEDVVVLSDGKLSVEDEQHSISSQAPKSPKSLPSSDQSLKIIPQLDIPKTQNNIDLPGGFTNTVKGPVVTDPDRPLILDPFDEISQNRTKLSSDDIKSGAENTDISKSENQGRNSLPGLGNFNTLDNNVGSRLNGNGPVTDGLTYEKSGLYQSNAIQPSNRLINSEFGGAPLDFQPGRSSLQVNVQRPLQVSPAPVCTFPQDFEEDLFELSTSEFGYPRSIVQQALKDSVAEAFLNILTDIMYDGILATHVPNYSQRRNPRRNSILKNNLYENAGLFGSQNSNNIAAGVKEGKQPFSSSFETLASVFGQGNVGASENEFRLSSGFGDEPQKQNQRNITSSSTSDSNSSNLPLSKSSQSNSQKQSIETKGLANEDDNQENKLGIRTSKEPVDIYSKISNPSPLPLVKGGTPSFPNSAFNMDTFNNKKSLLSQSNGMGGSFISSDLKKDGNNIDNLFPPKTSDMFLDSPSSSAGGTVGSTNFAPFNKAQQTQAEKNPFSFNSKSLFGSLSPSPFKSSLSQSTNQGSLLGLSIAGSDLQPSSFTSSLGSSSLGSGVQNDISSFAPSNFGNSNKLFGLGSNNGDKPASPKRTNGKAPGSQFGFQRMLLRKRRQVRPRPGDKRVTPTCSPTYQLLRQYKNYNGACFVVRPESQGVYFAQCSNSPCSGCRFEAGASRCTADRVPMWVWSYCEAGPNKGKVMPDRVQVSVTCSCKTAQCRSVNNGR